MATARRRHSARRQCRPERSVSVHRPILPAWQGAPTVRRRRARRFACHVLEGAPGVRPLRHTARPLDSTAAQPGRLHPRRSFAERSQSRIVPRVRAGYRSPVRGRESFVDAGSRPGVRAGAAHEVRRGIRSCALGVRCGFNRSYVSRRALTRRPKRKARPVQANSTRSSCL